VKLVALEPAPAGVRTVIVPVLAPLGTVAVSFAVETNVTDGELRLPNLTVAPGTKLAPLIVTGVPALPVAGLNELTVGAA
jgi:hypothetical protein